MDGLTVAAASGMRARMESLELLANNLANAGTVGYKADREFYNLYRSASAAAGADGREPVSVPEILDNWIDLGQGQLERTGQPEDLALDGPGFFAVDGPAGVLYTRGGAFRWSKEGRLVTREGYPVRAVKPEGTPREIRRNPDEAGVLTADAGGVLSLDGRPLGRLEIVDFDRPQALEKQGGGYFRLAETAATAAQARAAVYQGQLEKSNAAPTEAAVRMVSVLRQFEMLQRALQLGGEMNRRAAEEVAKV
ncbi:MAG: flagellar hook basal-body protein [Bryobacterales bacterium]|nr:flagellar hook basal-body protein [Bryobacterales bacterium]